MIHVEKALQKLDESGNKNVKFIRIDYIKSLKGVTPIVKFKIQNDPISEVGKNGCQAVDMLEYIKYLFQSFNEVLPCEENNLTISKIEEAIHWQDIRTKDRIKRNVEGKNIK